MTNKLTTDALGFPLTVEIVIGDLETLGQHRTFENYATGLVDKNAPHTIKIQSGLKSEVLNVVVPHEVYHLFFFYSSFNYSDRRSGS
jgi:hypothetical protein